MQDLVARLAYVAEEILSSHDNPASDITDEKFVGGYQIADLAASRENIPQLPGVYLVVSPWPQYPPEFQSSIVRSRLGREANVSADELRQRWVTQTRVLYVGSASGNGPRSTLQHRIRTYLRSGRGHAAPHWGGRFIWQLKSVDECRIYWRATMRTSARELEATLLAAFHSRYGRLPFANLQH